MDKSFRDTAEEIERLRISILFDPEYDAATDAIADNAEAVNFRILALGSLDQAQRFMNLAATYGEKAAPVHPFNLGADLRDAIAKTSIDYIQKALKQTGGNKSKAARLLGFNSYQTLTNWMKKYGIAPTEKD